MSELKPRAWVGCLGCYNDGRLTGEWFDGADVPQDMPAFDAAIWPEADDSETRRYHVLDGHEELWVMDHEGYGGFLKGECSPVTAARIAGFIESIPDYVPAEAVAAWLDNEGAPNPPESFGEIDDDFHEAYAGEHDSDRDFAQDLAEGLDMIDEKLGWPYSCIDWDYAASELLSSDYWSDGRYYFRNC